MNPDAPVFPPREKVSYGHEYNFPSCEYKITDEPEIKKHVMTHYPNNVGPKKETSSMEVKANNENMVPLETNGHSNDYEEMAPKKTLNPDAPVFRPREKVSDGHECNFPSCEYKTTDEPEIKKHVMTHQ